MQGGLTFSKIKMPPLIPGLPEGPFWPGAVFHIVYFNFEQFNLLPGSPFAPWGPGNPLGQFCALGAHSYENNQNQINIWVTNGNFRRHFLSMRQNRKIAFLAYNPFPLDHHLANEKAYPKIGPSKSDEHPLMELFIPLLFQPWIGPFHLSILLPFPSFQEINWRK